MDNKKDIQQNSGAQEDEVAEAEQNLGDLNVEIVDFVEGIDGQVKHQQQTVNGEK